ncbi:MAG: DUF424 family protein [Nanoarchaeota archaeon]|nr:DUF424 family protein [Nanoarchaeota archaeon]
MISVKIYEDGVVAMADNDLLGKKFEEGNLSLEVSEYFYKGEVMSKDEVKEVMAHADNLNLIGKKVVAIAKAEGYIKEEDILYIEGVPHVQVYSIFKR